MLVDRLQHETAAPGIGLFDLLSLEHWPRQGRPHRNLLLEYLKRARSPRNPLDPQPPDANGSNRASNLAGEAW
jgi:hypothetical protein